MKRKIPEIIPDTTASIIEQKPFIEGAYTEDELSVLNEIYIKNGLTFNAQEPNLDLKTQKNWSRNALMPLYRYAINRGLLQRVGPGKLRFVRTDIFKKAEDKTP